MHLQDLPGAILRHILNGENSWCAIELWKCGNRTLNARLANKGVTNIMLRARHRASTSRWPRCLSFFKLEHLSVLHLAGPLGTPATLRRELKKLPDTLITLKIHGYPLTEAIFPTPNSSPQVLPSDDLDATQPPSKRPKSVENEDDSRIHTMAWNLDTTWPRLERLELASFSEHRLPSATFSLLPRSLTYFMCRSRLTKPFNDLSQLPAGLQTLDLRCESIRYETMLTLPKSLTDVRDSLDMEAAAVWTASPSILPLLQRFTWELSPPTPSPPALPFSESLIDVAFIGFVTSVPPLSQLPSKLTRFSTHVKSCTFSTRQIASLPRTLERLFVWRMEWTGMKRSDFPPQLRELESHIMLGFCYDSYSSLPRTLTFLGFRPASALPPITSTTTELQELKVIGRQCLALDQERWSFAKSKLYKSGARREAYIARVEDGQLFGLPLGLTTLPFTPADGCQHFLLPPLVEHYKIDTVTLTDRETLSLIPPSEAFCVNISASIPSQFDTVSVIPTESSLYHSEITRLELSIDLYRSLSLNILLRCLPPTLTYLVLRSSIDATTDELQYLPASLTSLTLSVRILNPEAANWLGLLPRKLRTLHLLPEVLIRGAWLPQLPQNLTVLDVTFIDVTLSDLRALPPTMNSVIYNSTNDTPMSKMFAALRKLCAPFWRIREYSDAYLTSEIEKVQRDYYKPIANVYNDVDPRVSARFNL